jgi:hypothetical protein
MSPPSDTTLGGFSFVSLLSRHGKHCIFSRQPTLSRILQKGRNSLFQRGRADDLRIPHFNQDGTLWMFQVIPRDFHVPDFIVSAVVFPQN